METEITVSVLLKIGIVITCIGVIGLAFTVALMDRLRCPKCRAVMIDGQCKRCGYGMRIGGE